MKLISRAILLADAAARFWLGHWLLIVGSILIFVSAILKWLNFPFSHHPLGFQLPLFAKMGLIPHFSLLSYGVVGIAVLTIGIVLLWRSATFLALAAVAVLITLWMAAPCRIAFQEPALLGRLVAETQELPMIRWFTKSYLPVNYGPAETYSKKFEFDTIWDRFLGAYSFLAVGWYCFGIGSLLIAIYSIGRLPGERGMTALALGGVPIGVAIILLTPSLIGQHYFTKACIAQAQGAAERAIRYYRTAMWFDRWHAQDINIYAAIGDLERLSNLSKDSPEKHISKAREFKEATEYEFAIFELARAADWTGPIASVAQRESARTRVQFGLALYRVGGIGSAVTQWQQALAEDSVQQLGVTFLIARGNYDLGRYQASLDVLKEVIRGSADIPIRANAYSMAGDCYAKLGQDFDARRSYKLSLKEDMYANFWGMSRLIGN